MIRKKNLVAIGLLSMLLFGSCIGPMNLSRKLSVWNRGIENRWAGEGVFLVLRIAYIYPLCFLGDILIFNSMEFWGLNNPIEPPSPERIQEVNEKEAARNG
jgi:hypothetical protein